MTLKSSLLGFLATILFLFSCKKEISVEDGKIPGNTETTWKFSSDGTQYNGDMDSAFTQSAGGYTVLSMIGTGADNQPGELIIQIVGENISEAQYGSEQAAFQYSVNGQILYQKVPGQSGDFSVTITDLDSAFVSGTFSGVAYDTLGQQHTIIEGEFTAPRSSVSGPDPSEDGQLTVWASELCTDGSSIEILVNNQKGFISEATPEAPECGDPRTATFTLPQGVYTVTAICGTDTATFPVSVNSSCVKLMVEFDDPPIEGDYLPLTVNSYWEYVDLDNSSLSHRVTAGTDTVLDGRQYWMQISNLPDTVYYRKEGTVYYEYLTVDFNGAVENPPSIELPILHDDYAVGQSWEVADIPLNLSGINVYAKFKSTLLQKGSTNINGIDYPDAIEVRTELYFSTNGGATYGDPVSEYSRVFARGEGIVYYYDLERGTNWGASTISIEP